MNNPVYIVYAWVCSVGILVGMLQGGGNNYGSGLLECYTPVKLKYELLQPVNGSDESLSPIIFMHGVAGTKETWYHIPQTLADESKRTAYNLDARDHGESEYTDCFNYDINAADVLNFMDEQKIPKAVLIGYAMGAIAFMKVALWQPDRVEMVFFEEAYVKRIPTEQLRNMSKHIELFQEAAQKVPIEYSLNDAYNFVDKYFEKSEIPANSVGTSSRQGSESIVITLEKGKDGRYELKANYDVIIKTLKSPETTMSENKGIFGGLAYFIYGTESPYKVDQDEDNILDRFPFAQLLPVEGANHQLHGFYYEEFMEIVMNNINK